MCPQDAWPDRPTDTTVLDPQVIPKFIMRLMRGQKCCLHGDGSAKRTYVHAADVAKAFDLIIHRGKLDD